ncbi:MAG: pre-toxin TG domain-containing protein [Candidatus Nomurabacteria bacterium]
MPEGMENLKQKQEIENKKEAEYLKVQELKNNPEEMKREDEKYLVKKPEKKKGQTKRNIAGFIPFIGSGMDIKEAIKGKESITGKNLTKKERIVKGIFGVGGIALDVATFGADRLVVGAGERVAEVGVEKVAQSEAENTAKKEACSLIENQSKNANLNKKNFDNKNKSVFSKLNIKNWIEKKKSLNKNREMFKNIWPGDDKENKK